MATKGLRVGLNGLLIVSVLAIWHVLITRLLQGAPPVPVWWLLVVFLIVAANRQVARRAVGVRSGLDRCWAAIDGSGLAWAAFLLGLVWLFDRGFERASSDGREYFIQVRSLVIDLDLDFRNESAAFGSRGTAPIYAFGAAVLWTPFFALCHVWLTAVNLLGGSFALDGFTNAYQRAIGIGSLVYGWVGLVLVYRILSDYFGKALSAFTAIALCCGSFLIWYVTVENSMVHGVSFFATTLFLYVWHRNRWPASAGRWALIGAAAGLMTMVRWQNAAFVAGPAAYWVWRCWEGRRGTVARRDVATLLRHAGALVAGGVLAFLPQLIFWRLVRGAWLALPAGDHGFSLATLHVWDVLFSPNHGLFSWTPLAYLALLGLPLFFRRDRALATVLVVGFVGQVVINGGVDIWWGGVGFGARRFDNCVLVFGAGLASLLAWLRTRPLVAPIAGIVGLIAFNATFMLDVRSQRLPATDGITLPMMVAAFYARVGSPFSFPLNAILALRYDADLTMYDRIGGRSYNNLAITMGSPEDDPFIGDGWLARERTADFAFRWATGRTASLVVPLKSVAPYRLELRCAPFGYPGAAPQTIDVEINRQAIARLVLEPELRTYAVAVPANALRGGLNLIRFGFGYAQSPKATGLSDDDRQLAAMFASVTLTRQ